jgi:hypothetical protein
MSEMRARDFMAMSPEHAEAIELLNKELLIVFLRRLGGKVSIPCAEVDATEGVGLAFRIDDQKVFHFELRYRSDSRESPVPQADGGHA